MGLLDAVLSPMLYPAKKVAGKVLTNGIILWKTT
jgi:hypothetical protein